MRQAGNSGRSMAILAMSRRAILALPWLGKPTGKMPVVLMGKMPMLRLHARADLVGGVAPEIWEIWGKSGDTIQIKTPRPLRQEPQGPAEPPASPRGIREIKFPISSW
jgi:hypothetical protein